MIELNCKFLDPNNNICKLNYRKCKKDSIDECKIYQRIYNREIVENELYTIEKDVICCKCGHKGAIQYFGTYLPNGVPVDVVETCPEIYGKNFDKSQMNYAVGCGGTIPYKCTNCGNVGLIDCEGLEGYHMAFKSIKKVGKQ